ncbi:MAG TPA: DUF3800 domain-containing protein [Thermoanaerobaculia bacterium]|nr:DUF3800 domain-containing protein [Thermoanaerobaculia bacterium]
MLIIRKKPSAGGNAETRYRLYIDESGDHTFNLLHNDNHRYLGLLGIWFDVGEPYRSFCDKLQQLKQAVFQRHPDEGPVVLHRKDIIERRRVFGCLCNPDRNELFESGLLDVAKHAAFRMTCVVLDKSEHCEKTYRTLYHPYHYCLAALLERYAGWLTYVSAKGDVMAESRGRVEDEELRKAFGNIYRGGTHYHSAAQFQSVLTSHEIKLKKKEHNIAGLQLADLLAYPSKREIIAERWGDEPTADFSSSLLDAVRHKMNRRAGTGQVAGYGKVWLA